MWISERHTLKNEVSGASRTFVICQDKQGLNMVATLHILIIAVFFNRNTTCSGRTQMWLPCFIKVIPGTADTRWLKQAFA
ncbi:MAG: hypothetical protein GXP23_05135 [Gammaproteobacteria bacterium]|nr:hypothetical protein [Gammaproteobacteria bacterium]